MPLIDRFFGGISQGAGRALGLGVALLVLLGGAYALYRAWAPGPRATPKEVPEVAPGLPPIFDESAIVRPDSAGDWETQEIPGDFDATVTIDLPEDSAGGTRDSEGDEEDAVPGYVSIGLRRGTEQLFPELPGKRKLPLEAEVIGPSGGSKPIPTGRVRIKAQPQPIIAFALQAELGLSVSAGVPNGGVQPGGAIGVTGARVFGVRLGGVLAAGPSGGDGARLRAGPYVSLRVYGPLGVGVGKDVLSAPPGSVEGLIFTITTDLPL